MLTDAMRDALRVSAINYVQKHPADIAPRIASLKANIARLDAKAEGRALSDQAKLNRSQNAEELRLLEGFADTLGLKVEG